MTETSEPLEFTITGNGDFIRIKLKEVFGFPDETCHWGGYDTRSSLEISSSGFRVDSKLYIATGEIFNFYQGLSNCYDSLSGTANLSSYEGNLKLAASFNNKGHVEISGEFLEYSPPTNSLNFNFETDQSYLTHTISELKAIFLKYGNNLGTKGLSNGS